MPKHRLKAGLTARRDHHIEPSLSARRQDQWFLAQLAQLDA
jgi:hypothetical protein